MFNFKFNVKFDISLVARFHFYIKFVLNLFALIHFLLVAQVMMLKYNILRTENTLTKHVLKCAMSQ